ncbi:M48 family metallopeptidase [Rhodobacteraceae bacterium DSL-40]|uniref:M48 family metallopeptidase n=1 Tax=Amaricoccus sp. B4 TaxID=3368557 RepID=UPI000DAE5880
MVYLTPILLAVLYGLVMYQVSVWRTARALDGQSRPLVDPRLEAVFGRLAGALDLPGLKVRILEAEPINGLAAPDGRIFITRGFYEAFRRGSVSAEEIAGVIAHELGHVALGHSRRRMVDFSGQNAIRAGLAILLGRLLPGIGMLIANLAASLLGAHLSRSDEYEADAYAAALMTKAGLGTGPQVSLLAKLERLAGAGGRAPVWLASHPPTAERIAAIRRLEMGWQR